MFKLPAWISGVGLAEHMTVGMTLVIIGLALNMPSWAALYGATLLGIGHEWADGDLTTAPGAPYNGLIDVFFFALPPLLFL